MTVFDGTVDPLVAILLTLAFGIQTKTSFVKYQKQVRFSI
jgi:hypothetical protein